MADDDDYDDYDEISDGEKLAIVKYFVTHCPPGHTKTIIEGRLCCESKQLNIIAIVVCEPFVFSLK